MNDAHSDDLRYSSDHEWVQDRGERTGAGRNHRLRPGCISATSSSSSCPRSAPHGRRRIRSARSSRPNRCPTSTRRSTGSSSRSTPSSSTRRSGSTSDPYGDGLDLRHRARRRCDLVGLLDAEAYRRTDRGLRSPVDSGCASLRLRQSARGELLQLLRRSSCRVPQSPATHRDLRHRTEPRSRRTLGRGPVDGRACHRRCSSFARDRSGGAGSPSMPTRCRSAVIPRATSSSTTSRCRVATPRSAGRRRLRRRRTPAASTAPTSTRRGSNGGLNDGDELQVGKFKLVVRRARGRPSVNGRQLPTGPSVRF